MRALPGYAEALSEALRRVSAEHPGISVGDLERAADAQVVPQPEKVTAGLLIHMALSRPKNAEPNKKRKK